MNEQKPGRSIFRAYDIRGKAGRDLNAATAVMIGRALGTLARQRDITALAVGQDNRLSSPELAGPRPQASRRPAWTWPTWAWPTTAVRDRRDQDPLRR